MKYRYYDPQTDLVPVCIMLNDFYKEVHEESWDKIYNLDGTRAYGVEGKLMYFLEDGCKCRVAENEEGRLIGFLIYNLIYDTIAVVRGIYFVPDYRKSTRLYGIFKQLFRDGVIKVYSQTYANREPLDLRGEKRRRKLIATKEDMNIWEYTHGSIQQDQKDIQESS